MGHYRKPVMGEIAETHEVTEEHVRPVVQQHTVVQQPVYQQPVYEQDVNDTISLVQKFDDEQIVGQQQPFVQQDAPVVQQAPVVQLSERRKHEDDAMMVLSESLPRSIDVQIA